MSVSFRKGIREGVSLLIGLAGGTGSGKSFSGFRIASGICGDKPFAVIDTESRRGLHYADRFTFDHADLKPPFSPSAYAEAISAADAAGYPVIVVDSMSLEYSGEGGVLDMQEAELQRLAGDDWQKRERVKMASWIKPKMEHKKMLQRLLQVRAHLILCFRAEEKIEMSRDKDGKLQITKKQTLTGLDGWVPITEKNLPYELTASFLLMAANPGVPLPIKLQEQHKALFPLDQPITEESGRRIQEWASGKGQSPPPETATFPEVVGGARQSARTPSTPAGGDHNCISIDQLTWITDQCNERNISLKALEVAAGVAKIDMIPAAKFERVKSWIERHV